MKAVRPTPKAEETRSRIFTAALDLFRVRGFEPTTMREIAQAAGVALGSAYYYFASKEAIVMAFYEDAAEEMAPQVAEAMAGERSLEARLRALIEVKLRHFAPNRAFLGALVRHAADPEHPLSPLSRETAHIRERDFQHFSSAIEGSDLRPPKDLQSSLPKLLWLYQMGVILFWIYDRSEGQARTRKLMEPSLTIVVGLLRAAGLPLLRPMRKRAVAVAEAVFGE